MPELKPCPFCGCTDIRLVGGDSITILHCRKCKAEMCRTASDGDEFFAEETDKTKKAAIEAWNRRTGDGS